MKQHHLKACVPGDRSPPTAGAGLQCVPAALADPPDWCNCIETLSAQSDGSNPPSSRQTCSPDPERNVKFISPHFIVIQLHVNLNFAYLAAQLFRLQLLVAIWERLGELSFKCSQFLQRSSDTLFTSLPILHSLNPVKIYHVLNNYSFMQCTIIWKHALNECSDVWFTNKSFLWADSMQWFGRTQVFGTALNNKCDICLRAKLKVYDMEQ